MWKLIETAKVQIINESEISIKQGKRDWILKVQEGYAKKLFSY